MASPAPSIYDIGDTVVLTCMFTTLGTKGTISQGGAVLTVQDLTGYVQGDPILVAGAGPLGGDLVTTISSISGSTFTLATAAGSSVTAAFVGKPTDPSTVSCKVLLPDLTYSSPAASNPSVGKWTATYDPTQAGDHFYEFKGTGIAKGEEEKQFVVRRERVV